MTSVVALRARRPGRQERPQRLRGARSTQCISVRRHMLAALYSLAPRPTPRRTVVTPSPAPGPSALLQTMAAGVAAP